MTGLLWPRPILDLLYDGRTSFSSTGPTIHHFIFYRLIQDLFLTNEKHEFRVLRGLIPATRGDHRVIIWEGPDENRAACITHKSGLLPGGPEGEDVKSNANN